jgi:hypothetical protein
MVGVLFVVSMLFAAVHWRPRRHGAYRATRQQLRPAEGPRLVDLPKAPTGGDPSLDFSS